eukprot:scpid86819/ scgid26211/ 
MGALCCCDSSPTDAADSGSAAAAPDSAGVQRDAPDSPHEVPSGRRGTLDGAFDTIGPGHDELPLRPRWQRQANQGLNMATLVEATNPNDEPQPQGLRHDHPPADGTPIVSPLPGSVPSYTPYIFPGYLRDIEPRDIEPRDMEPIVCDLGVHRGQRQTTSASHDEPQAGATVTIDTHPENNPGGSPAALRNAPPLHGAGGEEHREEPNPVRPPMAPRVAWAPVAGEKVKEDEA